MDKFGYITDMSKNMERKLDLSAELYQRIMRELSVIGGFKGSWGVPRREGEHAAPGAPQSNDDREHGFLDPDRGGYRGRYKTLSNQVVANYLDGGQRTIYHYPE